MSSRAIYDSAGSYRERTKLMANSPSDTFYCSRCGKSCSILGRKLVARDGNRRAYACKKCTEVGGK